MNKTQENLLKAFAGESQARNRYTQFAKMARKENLEWVARVFEETADNERAHAEEEYELITAPVEVEDTLSIKPFRIAGIPNHQIGNMKMSSSDSLIICWYWVLKNSANSSLSAWLIATACCC